MNEDSHTRINQIPVEVKQQIIERKEYKGQVCKNCHELGHTSIKNNKCKYKIQENDNLRNKIKEYYMSTDMLSCKPCDEIYEELSILLNISISKCKTLYSEIPMDELLNRPINIEDYIDNLSNKSVKCVNCSRILIDTYKNTNKTWMGDTLCDMCWGKHYIEIEERWFQIQQYKEIKCNICNIMKLHQRERFYYDHINMFDKDNSICSMINDGTSIELILEEIDKCQILCGSCHHIVTDIEKKLLFNRIKQNLTRNLNKGEITDTEYNSECIRYQVLYEQKMNNIYSQLQQNFKHMS